MRDEVARQRDYAREYARRLELGRQRGYSRQIARGRHPGEGRRLPDGSRATVISITEIRSGRLRASTLETMHRMNAGLRSDNPEPWLAVTRLAGWQVFENGRSRGWHTIDDIPREILDAMAHRERNYFFGY